MTNATAGITKREERQRARQQILDAANAARRNLSLQVRVGLKPYSMGSIQEAVAACRKSRLVPAGVIEAAGFNALDRKGAFKRANGARRKEKKERERRRQRAAHRARKAAS
jgi:hypothetical protein